MASIDQIAGEAGVSKEGAMMNIGEYRIEGICPTNIAPLTAITASTTFYAYIGKVPKACKLVGGSIRSNAAGVGATTTLDVLKAASGTAPSAGTAIVTQVATNGLTPDTDSKLTVNTDGSQNIAAGSDIYVKIVAQGSETLKPVTVNLVLKP
jgi:hypothetical protein